MTMSLTALLSVHDKSGLVPFARGLAARGFRLVASGGTARALTEAGLEVTAVEALTGFAELLGGRVKTLHPAVHAGILSRRNAADRAELAARGIGSIDLVAVSLYPFEAALARGADEATLTEEIDIGGVTLLRAAAKSFAHVTVVPGPDHYNDVLAALAAPDTLPAVRRRLAAAALALTSAYDHAIAGWLGEGALRYGENPHQSAVFVPAGGATPWVQHAGKELSYNNLLDLDAAWAACAEVSAWASSARRGATAVVVKHGSPSGIACAPTATEALARAIAADPVSAFGGIIALDRPIDHDVVATLGDLFVEVIAAPELTPDALDALRTKKKNLRVLTLPLAVGTSPRARVRTVLGGLLEQSPDLALPEPTAWRLATTAPVDEAAIAVAAFAWLAAKHVKSNAIVLARRDGDALVTVGIGGGQTNRIDAVRQACARAGDRCRGAVLASDAFFPFADGIEAAAPAGIAAVVQPGGALRDADVIAAAERLGVTMWLTGRRHFRH